MAQVDYPTILEEAWQQHLAPRESDAPTVISTFAGCGGSSLGYSMAGFRELLAIEWDDNAVATFKLNFPDVSIYHGDIHKLTVEECLQLTGLQSDELDLLDGSPPCQGFSTAGKREMGDPRNQLYNEFVRLLRGLKPKVFVMENVSGMIKGKMKLIFADAMRKLKASGYQVKCKLLNAMYFDVPQSRERLIWIGVREDLGIEGSHPGIQSDIWPIEMIIKDAFAIRSIPINPWIDKYRSAPTVHTMPKRYEIRIKDGIRNPDLREYAILGSFPSGFQWFNNGFVQIGNSVPPLFMWAIANHIRQEILANV